MLSELELDLCNVIKAIACWDISIENLRINNAENPNFHVDEAWHSLDRYDKRAIGAEDLSKFLL